MIKGRGWVCSRGQYVDGHEAKNHSVRLTEGL